MVGFNGLDGSMPSWEKILLSVPPRSCPFHVDLHKHHHDDAHRHRPFPPPACLPFPVENDGEYSQAIELHRRPTRRKADAPRSNPHPSWDSTHSPCRHLADSWLHQTTSKMVAVSAGQSPWTHTPTPKEGVMATESHRNSFLFFPLSKFFQEKSSFFSFFLYFLQICFIAGHWYQSLTVSSVVGAPRRCCVLTT